MKGRPAALIGIDTNVILRAVLRDDDEQSRQADEFFHGLTPNRRGFITQVSLAEVYWVLSNTVRLPRDECLGVIRRLVQTEVLEFDDGESVVAALAVAEQGADFADALINASMRMFGTTENVTFDRGASRRLGWQLLEG
jgi:predicted nucleic-acid-binding protein